MARPIGSGLSILGQSAAPRERADAQRNRARILAVARKMLRRRHLDEICMDEVAELAGVGKGTLYRRFPDRSALLLAILDEDERLLQDAFMRSFDQPRGTPPREKLLVLLDALLEFHLDHARVLAAVEATARPFARFDNAPYAWRHQALARGLEEAGVADGPHAAQLSDVLLQALSGEVLLRAIERGDAEQTRAAARALFSTVVLPRKTMQS